MRWISAIAVSSIAVACCNAQQSVRRDPDRIWTFLAKRHDKNADGSIDLQEYGRGKERFASLDHDGDGVLTRADFERSVRGQRAPGRRVLSPGQRVGRDMADAGIDMQAVMVALARDADEDSDDRVTKGEWERFCKAQLEGDAFVVRRFQGRRAAPMVLSLILARLDTDASA
ncbi:MAG: hypothetical protein KDC95_06790, partial [Planctomycetes bacterium]|nr:hypothetical protein [Planctomycetota bacterium]